MTVIIHRRCLIFPNSFQITNYCVSKNPGHMGSLWHWCLWWWWWKGKPVIDDIQPPQAWWHRHAQAVTEQRKQETDVISAIVKRVSPTVIVWERCQLGWRVLSKPFSPALASCFLLIVWQMSHMDKTWVYDSSLNVLFFLPFLSLCTYAAAVYFICTVWDISFVITYLYSKSCFKDE